MPRLRGKLLIPAKPSSSTLFLNRFKVNLILTSASSIELSESRIYNWTLQHEWSRCRIRISSPGSLLAEAVRFQYPTVEAQHQQLTIVEEMSCYLQPALAARSTSFSSSMHVSTSPMTGICSQVQELHPSFQMFPTYPVILRNNNMLSLSPRSKKEMTDDFASFQADRPRSH